MRIPRNMPYLGQIRFNQLANSIEEINPLTLSTRLREMEKNGLIRHKICRETPIRVEYVLTEKGKALQPIIEKSSIFSMLYSARAVFKDGKQRAWEEVYGKSTDMGKSSKKV